MNTTQAGRKRGVSSVQLLLTAGAAFMVAIIIARVYPYLVSSGVPAPVLTAVRAVLFACLAALVISPIAAIIRRLIH